MSIINTSSIDTGYPVAGQDNDSQGFRDNFTNINSNFTITKSELEELQENAILKGVLTSTGDPVDNDFAGNLIKSAKMQDMRNTVSNLGVTGGSIPIDVSLAPYHKLTPNASINLSFSNFSPAGTHSTVQVEIKITNVNYTVTLPAAVVHGLPGLQNINGLIITFKSTGTFILEFSTADNGASISVDDLTQAKLADRQLLVSPPAASIGALGDLKGMIAFDATYMYLCTADYDAFTSIWIRTAASTWV